MHAVFFEVVRIGLDGNGLDRMQLTGHANRCRKLLWQHCRCATAYIEVIELKTGRAYDFYFMAQAVEILLRAVLFKADPMERTEWAQNNTVRHMQIQKVSFIAVRCGQLRIFGGLREFQRATINTP